MAPEAIKLPLTTFISTIQDGRFLRIVFLGMLALTVATLAQDFSQMVANSPDGLPGSQRLEPAPMELPTPGDQTRTYLPKTMPLSPSRKPPRLPGYFGPIDGTALSLPMKFVLGDEGKATAIGTIDSGATGRLKQFLEKHDRQISEIVLHSPGGSVSDGLAMGRLIRAAGISTRVSADAYCASSCPLVLAGGLYRTAGKRSYIGVHQVYALPSAVGSLHRGMADAQAISAECQRYLQQMGVDLKIWVKAMATPPAQLYLLTPDELSRFNLANGRRRTALPTPRPLTHSVVE